MYPKLFLNSEVSFSIFDFKLSFCLGKESHLQPSGDCDVVSDGVPTKEEEKVHVALALVQYYLSLNYLETEEFSQVNPFKFLLYHNTTTFKNYVLSLIKWVITRARKRLRLQ